LAGQNREREAKAGLQWLRGLEIDISEELNEMETANNSAQNERLKPRELLQVIYIKPLLVSMGLMFFQQLSGINAVMFYSVNIFRLAGSSINSNLATIILGTSQLSKREKLW
jgi:facilitated trehalose transporter